MALASWALVVLVGPDGAEVAAWSIEGHGNPDLAVVDALARSQLRARRLGGAIHLEHGSKELLELLDLVGLGREVRGEPEGGEQVLGVEEGVERRDPRP
jgi:hypothetical protein